MKKGLISLMLIFSILMGLTACNSGSSDDTESNSKTEAPTESSADKPTEGENSSATPEESSAEPTDSVSEGASQGTAQGGLDNSKTYKILFIGNSFTHYNKMPSEYFAGIVRGAGYKVFIDSITKGGWYLDLHADPTDEENTGAKLEAALSARTYDYVIIQEQSVCPIENPGRFYSGARSLVKRIRENGATPIFYETWAYDERAADVSENGWTYESMEYKIAASYAAIGKELGVDVVYAGLAFKDVYENNKSINLYHTDFKHPSPAGSYLAALSLFGHIFKCDPNATTFNGSFTDNDASILKAAAKKAVFDTPEIPAEYNTTSEGVELEKYPYGVNFSKMNNLTSFPTSSIISVLTGGTYPNGKTFSGILGTLGKVASTECSTTGLTAEQKADIANIGYGVSIIGAERMDPSSKGYETSIENFVNGHWGNTLMANLVFDDLKYDINGNAKEDGKYTSLITLNFSSKHRFDAIGFFSGSLHGFPGVAEVYVSDDGVNWTIVPTACWDSVTGKKLTNCGASPRDPWKDNSAKISCLFGMEGVTGQYIRIGVVVGRSDSPAAYNTINTREIVVYGEKIN